MNSLIAGTVLRKRLQILGTTLRARPIEYKAALTAAMSQLALPKFADGSFKLVIDKSFELEEAQAAHEYLEGNTTVGKVLLKVAA